MLAPFLLYCFTVLHIIIFLTSVCRIVKCSFEGNNAWKHCYYWFRGHDAIPQMNRTMLWLFACMSVLNQDSTGRKGLIILAHITINKWKRLDRWLSHSRRNDWARTGAVFPCFASASTILQFDVMVITYHSLANDCDSPSDLQSFPGVTVGREVCGMEGGGHSPSDTRLQVNLPVSSSVVISENSVFDLCLGAF